LQQFVLLAANEWIEPSRLVILVCQNLVLRVIRAEIFSGAIRPGGFARVSRHLPYRLGYWLLGSFFGGLRRFRVRLRRFWARRFLRRALGFRRRFRTLFFPGAGHIFGFALDLPGANGGLLKSISGVAQGEISPLKTSKKRRRFAGFYELALE
jgi:hypothetical protein